MSTNKTTKACNTLRSTKARKATKACTMTTQCKKQKTTKLHNKLVSTAMKAGITDNHELTTLFHALTSHDKLRGVKRSITVSAPTYVGV